MVRNMQLIMREGNWEHGTTKIICEDNWCSIIFSKFPVFRNIDKFIMLTTGTILHIKQHKKKI